MVKFSMGLSHSDCKKPKQTKPQPSTRAKLTKVVTMVSENKTTLQLVNVPCDYL